MFWSAAAENLLGWRASDVARKPCALVLDRWDSTGVRICKRDCGPIEITHRHRPVRAFDGDVKTSSGTRKWVSMSILAARFQGKDVIVHLLRDIDSQKRTESLANDIVNLVGKLTSQKNGRDSPPVRLDAPAVDSLGRRPKYFTPCRAE